ncbi:MAG: DNA translocase FtsK [Bacteroidales bacterium]|jgi:S-DNA-T family DNA segregation ATPase FtsK/SpoIIIE|nr:DNA translocase FtsK [Bacteroidales bacterium]
MAQEKDDTQKKKAKSQKDTKGSKPFFTDERIKFIAGIFITGLALYLLVACISYLFSWKADDSLLNSDVLSGAGVQVQNWGGKFGTFVARYLMAYGYGYGALFIPPVLGVAGLAMLKLPRIRPGKLAVKFAFAAILVSLISGFLFGHAGGYLKSGPGGAHGYFIAEWLRSFAGTIGAAGIITVFTAAYLIFALKVKPASFAILLKPLKLFALFRLPRRKAAKPPQSKTANGMNNNVETETETETAAVLQDDEKGDISFTVIKPVYNAGNEDEGSDEDNDEQEAEKAGGIVHDFDSDLRPPDSSAPPSTNMDIPLNIISKPHALDILDDDEIVHSSGNYDPRLDLSRYKFPPVSILKDYKADAAFDNTEILDNKENIIKTLGDYKIGIKSIAATIGPTVTLYEIVPERGVKISRIRSLEDDIALNLSAIGIRIIAPIPGRGTVGIEVPNKKPEMVSMKSLVTSKTFQESKFDIALALGRTITNEPYIVDLTKMPHLLVAGATGQGKSVGINTIIASILFKKHPSELKLVLIDPKRVELPLYSKIERHFLAKLPGEEDAIITDTQKVINTLNSLCIEMDNRLELLKAAQSRNIKEYNEKFISRKLNPEKGHKYLPYIVLIIDEFADLIMTAGREIEGPIGRLAQLARAIGIHLIISTQRPSANIITGFIKANFPTRVAFRVFSSVDSRTILDATGADRLVGRGDMLISSGNEPVRVQCAFVDTPEIEELTEYIGAQQGYPDAMHLPEYVDDSESGAAEVDLRKRDSMFEDAARLVVQHQQGSTSLIQRKLSIGYNRAGRIIDQLEAAGVVGPFEGSKAREVICADFISLEHILKNLE